MSKSRKPKAQPGRKPALRTAAEARLARSRGKAQEPRAKASLKLIHELEVHQIELEMQNEELNQARQALEESRDRYVDLYDFGPLGYFTFTRGGRILQANLTGASLLGVPRARLLRRGLGSFVAAEDRDRWERHLASVLQSAGPAPGPGEKQGCELKLQREDGSTFHARLESVRLERVDWQEVGRAGVKHPIIRTVMSDITARVRAERAAEEAHARVAAMLESITDAFFSLDREWRFTIVNQEAVRLLGCTREQLIGHGIWEMFPPAVGSRFQQEYERALAENKTVHFEEFYPPLGKWFEVHAYPAAAGLSVYFQDITERHQAEAALRESEEQFRLVLEESNDAIFWADPETGILIRCNRKAEELTGRTRDELIGMHQTQLHPSDQDYRSQFQQVSALSSAENIEAEVLNRAGKRTPVLINTTVVTIGAKKIIQGIFRDVTERKRTEDLRQENEQQLRLLLEHSNDAIFWADAATGHIVRCNRRTEELTERTRAELIGMHVEGLHPPGPDYREIFQRLAAVPSTENVEAEFISRTGKRTPALVNFSVVTIGQQKIVQGIARDITARKQAENALRESEAQLRLVLEHSNDAIFWADAATGHIVRCNRRTEELTERTRAELIGMHVEGLHPPGPDYREIFQRLAAVPSTENVEAEFISRTGKRTPALVNFSVVTIGQQKIVQGIARDITERKRTESYREMGREALRILNEPGDLRSITQSLVAALKAHTGFEAVGLRLRDGEDFPYFAHQGLSKEFLLTENTLLGCAADGGVFRGKDGKAGLECACGLVLSGQTDPANPFFTSGGSWWTNDLFPLLDVPPGEDFRRHPRNRCIHEGFASMALVPIRMNDRIVGLIQFNDRRKDCFTLNSVELLEGIAAHIGAALMRQQAEEALRESEDRYRTLVEESPDLIAIVQDGRIVFINPVGARLSGVRTKEELLGRNFEEWIHPEDSRKAAERIRRRLAGDAHVYPAEVRYRRLDGTTMTAEVSAAQINFGGKPALQFIARDITERKRAEEGLKTASEQRRLVLEAAGMGTWDYRFDSGEVFWDERCRNQWGVAHGDQIDYARAIAGIHPEDRAATEEAVKEALAGKDGGVYHREFRVVWPDGSVHWIDSRGQVYFEGEGEHRRAVRFIGANQDITERVQMEARLQLLFKAVEATASGIVITDRQGTLLWVNPAFTQMTGYSRDEAVGQKTSILKSGEQSPEFYRDLWARILRGDPWQGQLVNRRKDGTVYNEEMIVTPVRTGDEITHFVAVMEDVTQQLSEAELRYRTVADFTYDWEYWIAPDGKLLYCSPSCERISGYTATELVADPGLLTHMVLSEDQDNWQQHQAKAITEPAGRTIVFRIQHKDGGIRWIEHVCHSVIGKRAEPLGLRVSNRDITERIQTQMEMERLRKELAHVTRVTTAGQLAASLAHELNQPLTAISCNVEAADSFMAAHPPNLKEVQEALNEILSDSQRAGGVIQRLRALFNKTGHQHSALQLNEVITETMSLLRSEFVLNNVLVQLELADELPMIMGDSIELQQVVLNLIVNALEAMAECQPPFRRLRVCTGLEDPGTVRVSIQDCGTGIPEELLSRLFEPFFTTKATGMGMGLPICRTIIESHGGRLWAVNNPDRGATFQFTLPIAQGASA